MHLVGKVALVTGGASGMGRGFAEALLKAAAKDFFYTFVYREQKFEELHKRGPYVDCDSPCSTSVWITKAAGGCIVNVASMAGLNSNPFSPVYGCTKAGIIHATRCYAVSEAAKKSNIRLNVLCPAFVDTPMFRRMAEVDASQTIGGDQTAVNAFIERI